MELRPGYKHTEVGPLPIDWCADPIGPKVRITSGESPSLFHFEHSGVPYFKVEQLNNDSQFLQTTPYYVRSAKTVPGGSLIFPKRGASIALNKVRILKQDSYMDTNLMALTPDPSIDPAYFYYAVTHIGLARVADTTSIPQINNKHIIPLVVPLPPGPEQRAIAAALGDVDALLAAFDKLIAKKRDIKGAAMQQLLTGQTRLPGFRESWQRTTLGKVGTFSKGRGIRKDEVVANGLPCVRYGEIYTHHSDYVRRFHSFITQATAAQSQRLLEGDLLFAASGETAEEIGKCVAFLGNEEAYAGGDIVIFSPQHQDSTFLAYLMNHSTVVAQKAQMGQGEVVVHISAKSLSRIRVLLPDLAEQAAIAKVLADLDAELTALEARRDKTQLLKQGMMQELLTGRTRLV